MKTYKFLFAIALGLGVILALLMATALTTKQVSADADIPPAAQHVALGIVPTQTPCATVPPKPLQKSPQNGYSTIAPKVTLAWYSTRCTMWYQLTLRRDSTTGAVILNKVWTTNTSRLTPKLTPGHTYYWVVQACDSPFGCAASIWKHFTVEYD